MKATYTYQGGPKDGQNVVFEPPDVGIYYFENGDRYTIRAHDRVLLLSNPDPEEEAEQCVRDCGHPVQCVEITAYGMAWCRWCDNIRSLERGAVILEGVKAAFEPVAGWHNGDGGRTDLAGMVADAVEDLQCDRQAVLDLRKRTQWRPFETAPKDGTEILVFDEDIGVFMAEFDDGWFADGDSLMDHLPAFWMPLPSEPDINT